MEATVESDEESMGKSRAEVEVGERVSVFRCRFRVRNLRRHVDVALAQRGEKHQDAARRAGVTPTWWSRLLNAPRISEHDLGTIAKGIGVTPNKLKSDLEIEEVVA